MTRRPLDEAGSSLHQRPRHMLASVIMCTRRTHHETKARLEVWASLTAFSDHTQSSQRESHFSVKNLLKNDESATAGSGVVVPCCIESVEARIVCSFAGV